MVMRQGKRPSATCHNGNRWQAPLLFEQGTAPSDRTLSRDAGMAGTSSVATKAARARLMCWEYCLPLRPKACSKLQVELP